MTMEFNDFFYYMDGNLIAYLALYTFENDEAEMSALVHPNYRQEGIFKKLLGEALLELRQRHISQCVWVRPHRSVITPEYLAAKNGRYTFSQVEMIAKNEPVAKELPELHLQQATRQDIVTLAEIGAICFNSSFSETHQRFLENMNEKNRLAWIASLPDGKNIGKIHVRYDEDNTAYIHDLCILPAYRGKNYATAMILKTMQMLRENGQQQIFLDVECHNEGALRLYQQCGYVTSAGFDFWRVPTAKM
ncbi:unnamed protein product [marine sediment metagenome]|uniref:N-acetyltransferase domain-containing protein n=1 Tax=marine sediment metagenome TaxID=412755 RepID=X0SRT6_9ZZZZ